MPDLTLEEKELIERFQLMVRKVDNESCWEWLGSKNDHGQGIYRSGNESIEAHVLSWLIFFNHIPEGKEVWHRCNSISCVNPYHLYLEDANMKMFYKPKPLPKSFKELTPGTHRWKEFWETFPEQQDEMLEFKKGASLWPPTTTA